jgi:hypothetical protein
MASKPVILPRWATAGAIATPSEGKKDTGHVGGEQSPAEHFNWLLNLLYQWMQYLDAPDGMTFGGGILGSIANALLARLTVATAANATSPYTRVATFGSVNVYAGASDGTPSIVFAVNAQYGALGTWSKITNGQFAVALFLRRDRVVLASMPAAQNTAWTDAFVEGAGTASGFGRLLDWAADAGLTDTISAADIARLFVAISSTAGVERILIAEFKSASIGSTRLYAAVTNGDTNATLAFEITTNCKWNNNTNLWSADVTGVCLKYVLAKERFAVRFRVSTTAGSTFNDAAGAGGWNKAPIDFQWQTDDTGGGANNHVDDANPPSNVASLHGNALYAKNIPKAWARIADSAAADGGAATVVEGFNIASVVKDATNDKHVVTLTTGFATANSYCVEVTAERPAGNNWVVGNVTFVSATVFEVQFVLIGEGSPASAVKCGISGGSANADFKYSISVYGQQTT